MCRLLVADARRQAVLFRVDQLADDALDPFVRFALAEDDFGKAAAARPVTRRKTPGICMKLCKKP